MLSNCLLEASATTSAFALEVYEKLIGALSSFYEDAKAPSMLKSLVFTLLSRLIVKLKHIYHK